jgi:hypothetical protein
MLRLTVTNIDINMIEANRLLNSPQGEVADLVVQTSRRVRAMCVRETPVQDGDMVRSYGFSLRVRPFRYVMGRVTNSDEAALWVQTGTGIYGRRGAPITPRRARGANGRAPTLRFIGKRDGALLYRHSVKGQPANPFMFRGLLEGTVGRQVWTIRPGAALRGIR